MNANFRSQSVDGFGERPDIALERDRNWEDRVNFIDNVVATEKAIDKAKTWGSNGDKSICDLIFGLMKKGGGSAMIFVADYGYQDPFDCFEDALIELGEDSDDWDFIHYSSEGGEQHEFIVGKVA